MRYSTLCLLLVLIVLQSAQGQMLIANHSLIQLTGTSLRKPVVNSTTGYLQSPLGFRAFLLYQQSYDSHTQLETSNKQGGLWIEEDGVRYKYSNEHLEIDGQRLRKFGSKNLRRITSYLKKLERRSAYARNIIHTLQASKNQFTVKVSTCTHSYMVLPLNGNKKGVLNNNAYAFQIMESEEKKVDYAPFDQIGSGAEIRWNPEDKLIIVAHELSHAYDANYGLMDDRKMILTGRRILYREIRAIYHENKIRNEMNMKLRRKVNGVNTLISDGEPFTYDLPSTAKH